jgi:hypothetical protein
MKVPQTTSIALFTAVTPYVPTTNQASQLMTWSTSGDNRIILGSQEYFGVSSIKFKDFRVYTDLSAVSLPAAPFAQIKVACVSNCLSCSDVDVCLSCESGFYLEGGLCKGCNYSCRTCRGAGPYACLTCVAPLIHTQEGSCPRTCPPWFAEDADCKLCSSQCKSCVNSQECSICKEDLYELKQQGALSCLPECPGSYFVQQRACMTCSSSCKSCSGPTTADCLECAQEYALIGGRCAQCPVNAYFDGLECLACESSCKTCSSPGACVSCPQDKTLSSEGLCISSSCPTGSYLGDTGCVECPRCESCESEGLCDICACEGDDEGIDEDVTEDSSTTIKNERQEHAVAQTASSLGFSIVMGR